VTTRFLRRDILKLGAMAVAAPAPPLTFTLAFGSCNKPALVQPLWGPIFALRPDAWLWLGDIVYADTEDIATMRGLYDQQKRQPAYATFAATTRVLGIWDDHDYGMNDAGADYPKRAESQAALLDFLGEPADSLRRKQAGIYTSYVFGSGADSVKLILLDTRYHRQPPGPDADTLGAEQWSFLERELAGSPARVNLIASGYQVLPTQHAFEKWANFPRARQRLLELVRRTRARGVVFLSGDRHFSELSRLELGGQAIYELTSSGLTHSFPGANEPNQYRVGSLFPKLNFGFVRVDFAEQRLTLAACGVDCTPAIHHVVPLARRRVW
jgi:alkaline phosphatase D